MRRAALLAVAALAACGDSPKTGPLRVEIVVASADREAPSVFSLRSEDGKTTLALEPSEGSATSLSADGVAGKWFVVPPEGWGVVGTKDPLWLQPDLAPTPVPIGRRHSIYLAPTPGSTVGDVEVVRDAEKPEPVAVEIGRGADGRVVLRVKSEDWKGALLVTAVVDGALLTNPMRVILTDGSGPTGVKVRPGSTASLDVRMFRPEDGKPADGIDVVVSGTLGKLTVTSVGRTDADGVARFPMLSALVPSVAISQQAKDPEAPRAVLWAADWRSGGEVRFMTRSAKAPVAVGVTLPTDDKEGARLNVQVRPQGGASYALVDPGIGLITTSRDLHHVLLPPGVHVRVFATAGGRGGFAELSGEPDTITIVKYEDLCTLRAKIPQSRGERHPVRVLCRRKEGEEEVLAQGWSVVAQTPGLADVSLPVGTYRVCILEGTREGPSVTWTFDKPGSQAQIDLTLP